MGFSSSFTEAEGKTLFRFENAHHTASLERFCFYGGGKIQNAATEWGNPIGVTQNNGRTEVLGGLMVPAEGFKETDAPAFVVQDGEFSATGNEISFGSGNYRVVIRGTRKGKTLELKPKGEGTQRAWPLYSTIGG